MNKKRATLLVLTALFSHLSFAGSSETRRAPKEFNKYIKLDFGASNQTNKAGLEYSPFSQHTRLEGATPMVGVSFGMYLQNNMRGEISLQRRRAQYYDNTAATIGKATITNKSVFLNGYYDFKPFEENKNITPYLTAGVGFSRNHAGNLTHSTNASRYTGANSNALALSAGIGLKIKETKHLEFDISLKRLYLGKIKYSSATLISDSIGTPLKWKTNELSISLTYNL